MHVLNNLPKEYNIILENHLISTGPDVLTIEVVHNKLNQW